MNKKEKLSYGPTTPISQHQYTVRRGTIDTGKDYEIKMAALVALRCISADVEDAALAYNAEYCSDFDDLVVYRKLKNENTGKVYLIQLKHQDKTKLIKSSDFCATSGNFSLSKYMRGYEQLQKANFKILKQMFLNNNINNSNLELVLYSNRNVDVVGHTLKPCNFIQSIDLENHFLKTGGEIYAFDEKYFNFGKNTAKFFKNLFLFAEQVGEQSLNQLIMAEIEKIFPDVDKFDVNLVDNFVSFITYWAKGHLGGHYTLNKNRIISELTTLLLDCTKFCNFSNDFSTIHKNVQIIDEMIVGFDIVSVSPFNKSTVKFILNYLSKWLMFSDGSKFVISATISKTVLEHLLEKFPSLSHHLPKRKIIEGVVTLTDVHKALWRLQLIPLVLFIEDNAQSVYVGNILSRLHCHYKFVILSNSPDIIPSITNAKILSNLSDLNENFTHLVLNNEMMLQGRPNFKLQSVIETIPDIKTLIPLSDIIYMSSGAFVIGDTLKALPQYYIPREIPKIFLNFKVFHSNDAFFVTSSNKFYFKRFLHRNSILNCIILDNVEMITESDQNSEKCLIILSSEDHNWKSKIPNRNTHFLKFYPGENQIEWLKSNGDLGHLRSCSQSQSIFYSLDACGRDILNEFPNSVNIIAGEPGIGKSVALDAIALQIPVNHWVLKINLNDYIDYYYNLSKVEACTLLQYFSTKLLESQACNSELNKAIFSYFLNEKRILILLDGFDEICPSYKDIVTEIVEVLRDSNFKIWITTRSITQSHVEQQFNSFSFSLSLFTRQNQKDFLNEYFEKSTTESKPDNKISNFIVQLLDLAETSLKNTLNLMGIPLQTRMLAEVFLQDFQDYMKTGYFKSEHNLDILFLYELFIKLKEKEFVSKFDCNYAFRVLTSSRKYHMIFAVRTLFRKEDFGEISSDVENQVKQFRDEVSDGRSNIGIVLSRNMNLAFVHRTFAEYYAAVWLAENYQNSKYQKIAVQLTKKLIQSDYELTRNFFDRYVVKAMPLHTAVMNRDLNLAKNILKENKNSVNELDILGRNAFCLLAQWGTKFLINEFNKNNFTSIKKYDRALITVESELAKLLIGEKNIDSKIFNFVVGNKCLAIMNEFATEIKDENISENLLDAYLYYCAKYGFSNLMSALLDKYHLTKKLNKLLIKVWWHESCTLLQIASRSNQIHVVKLLLENRADIHQRNELGSNALHHAVKYGNEEVVKLLLSNGAQIQSTTRDGRTSLHFASEWGHDQITKLLLFNGANVHATEKNGDGALHFAAQKGHKSIIELLVANGANINANTKTGYTALHYATYAGHEDVIRFLLDSKADMQLTVDDGETLLHCAVRNGNKQVLELLLSFEVNVQVMNNRGHTPLHFAAANGNNEVFEALRLHGANAHAITKNGETVLHYVAKSGSQEMFDLILSKSVDLHAVNRSGDTVLHYAAESGNVRMVELLLSNGVNVNVVNKFGNTALHYAAGGGNVEVIKLLVSWGLSVTTTTLTGHTALHYAVENVNTNVIPFLLANGAMVNASTTSGKTVLHCAAQTGSILTTEMLLDNEAIVNASNAFGETALHYAVKHNNYEMAELLLSMKINVQAVNSFGETAFHYAVKQCEMNMVQLLLLNGASVQATTNDGKTALHFATQNINQKIAELLFDNGINIHAVNNDGETALHFAAKNSNTSIIETLLWNEVNVNATTEYRRTALHYATQTGGNSTIQLLCINGADVNAADEDGKTSLHYAAIRNNDEVIEIILSKNVNVNSATVNGQTALHYAAESGNIEMVQLLLLKGGNIHALTSEKNSVLHFGVKSGNKELVKLLLAKAANVHEINNYGETVLHTAVRCGHKQITELLLASNVNVHAITEDDRHALFYAKQSGNKEIIKLLLAYDANQSIKTE